MPSITSQSHLLQAWRTVSKSNAARITLSNDEKPETSNALSDAAMSLFPGYDSKNREAYFHLFHAIHAENPTRSEEVMRLMNDDVEAGKPLTAQMVKRAILTADSFSAKWSKKTATYAALSPRTPLGQKLIHQFDVRINERLLFANTKTSYDQLTVLNTIKQEIQDGNFACPEIQKKLESLIDLHIQRTTFKIKVTELKILFLSAMQKPATDCWRLVMDGKQQHNGVNHFENEQGYMAGMLRALNLMIDTLDEPLDAALYCALHDFAVDQVYERTDLNDQIEPGSESVPFLKNYRTSRYIDFALITNLTCSMEGRNEFLMSSKLDWSAIDHDSNLTCEYPLSILRDKLQDIQINGKKRVKHGESYVEFKKGLFIPEKTVLRLIEKLNTYDEELQLALKIEHPFKRNEAVIACREKFNRNVPASMNTILEPLIQKACNDKAAEIIATYNESLAVAQKIEDPHLRETAILRCIAICCQDLFQHHLFEDGNTRTIMLVMIKFLLQNGYSPTIFHEPNAIAMYSVDQLVALIREGQKTFQQLLHE